VRYRLTAPPLGVYACHCRDCQRETSGPYAVGAIVPEANFEVLTAAPLRLFEKRAESGRDVPQFSCARCGTRMWHRPKRTPDQLVLKVGTLDDASWAVPVVHIWTSGRLPWVRLEGAARAYEGALPDRDILYAEWDAFLHR
jgi:hypothetical protein